ncbi:MAG: hypothetical protein WBX25_37770 [Rhodomicrobium sp.]
MSVKAIIGAALAVIAVCLAAGGVYAVHVLKHEKVDAETLCPSEGSNTVTLVIIDKTDPLTAAEQGQIRNVVEKARDNISRGDRLTVKVIRPGESANETVLDTVADLCNPGAEANPLFENPKRVAARYQAAFIEPVKEALASLNTAGEALQSPIARAITSAIDATPANSGQQIRLILISDLMEHTEDASAYAGTLKEASLRKLMTKTAQARLKDASIQVLLLHRSKYAVKQEAAAGVWRRFLQEVTGREPEFLGL